MHPESHLLHPSLATQVAEGAKVVLTLTGFGGRGVEATCSSKLWQLVRFDNFELDLRAG